MIKKLSSLTTALVLTAGLLATVLLASGFVAQQAEATPVLWEADYGDEIEYLTGEDDEEYDIDLTFAFTFLGESYTTVTVSTNGYVGLGGGTDESYPDGVDDLLDADTPIIAPFWSDMDLDEMGMILANDFGDRVVFTWDTIGSYEDEYAPFTFQLQLLDNGQIIFGYNGISETTDNLDEDLIVGLSPGGDVSDPGENDYSADSPFIGGDTIYEVFEYYDESFDLDNANLVFTPVGSFSVTRVLPPESVPEPASLAILGFGLMGVAAARRRRKAA